MCVVYFYKPVFSSLLPRLLLIIVTGFSGFSFGDVIWFIPDGSSLGFLFLSCVYR